MESMLGHQVASSKGRQAIAAVWQSHRCCGICGKVNGNEFRAGAVLGSAVQVLASKLEQR
jgi:hypothetical protein